MSRLWGIVLVLLMYACAESREAPDASTDETILPSGTAQPSGQGNGMRPSIGSVSEGRTSTSVTVSRPSVKTSAGPLKPLRKLDTEVRPSLEDFVGAEVCGDCHADVYETWEPSTHGQAGGEPSAELIIPSFADQVLQFKDAEVDLLQTDGTFQFRVRQRGFPVVEYDVDAVVGAGRIHGGGTQTFFTRSPDGRVVMMPFDYSATDKAWFCQSPDGWKRISKGLSLSECAYPPTRPLGQSASANCQDCHGSQIELSYDRTERRFDTRWRSLGINCESCHGPGRQHVDLMRSGYQGPDIGFNDLSLLSKEESVALCARCHMDKTMLAPGYLTGDDGEAFFTSVHLRGADQQKLDVDGKIRGFSYSESHLYSDCYLNGSMTCIDCHNPHDLHYRDPWGQALVGRFDDRQCTGCHPSKVGGDHQRHPGELRCTDCHMPMRQHPNVGQEISFKRSDHAVSIPRAVRTLESLKGHACGDCHQDKDALWLREMLPRMYGEIKPLPEGADEVETAEALSLQLTQGSMPKVPGTAAKAVLKVSENHPALIVRALSTLVVATATGEQSQLTDRLLERLLNWSSHDSIDVQGASIAASLFLDAYRPGLAHKAWDALSRGEETQLRALRRRVIFNLLAIENALAGRSVQGQASLRGTLETVGPQLAEGELPWAVFLAFSYKQNQQLDEAIKWTRRALRDRRFQQDRYTLDQAGSEGRLQYQLFRYYQENGQEKEAGIELLNALNRLPDDPEIKENMCAELLRTKQSLPALKCIERYLELRPTFIQGHFIKAQLLEAMGRYPEAIASAEEGLRYQPGNQVARDNLERLKRKTP